MSEKGWIKLHRQIQDCWIWQEKPFDKRSAWIDLLLSATHTQKKMLFNGKLITIKRGQYLTSVRKLSDRWGWSYDKCLRFLKLLENDNMIVKESNKNRTLLTIVNYEVYQDVATTDNSTNQTPISEQSEQPQANNPNSNQAQVSEQSEQPQANNPDNNRIPVSDKQECKNEKNDKNGKNQITKNYKGAEVPKIKCYYSDELLNQAFLDYLEMRKKIRKPMTDRAITLAMNKLKELSSVYGNMNNDLAIKILEQSILSSWQGLFPLRGEEEKKEKNNKNLFDDWSDA